MEITFDFVIVGAGSAGCVLAERLSANGRHTVLLLEAGGSDRRFFVQMPLGYGKTFYDETINWGYRAEPDPGLNGQSDYWPRGKILGGSSSINAMVYVRGHRGDYEDWKAAGNPGWGWDDVLPAYRAIEDNEQGGDAWRGQGGPLFIRRATLDHHALVAPFIAASERAGLKFNADFNGAEQEGVGTFQLTDQEWHSQFGGAGVFEACDETQEFAGRNWRAGQPHPVRWNESHRRRVCEEWPDTEGAGRPRGDRRGRCRKFAAASATFRRLVQRRICNRSALAW